MSDGCAPSVLARNATVCALLIAPGPIAVSVPPSGEGSPTAAILTIVSVAA